MYEAGFTMMNRTDVIPVLRVVRRYSGLFRHLLEHVKLFPSSRPINSLSGIIILYVFDLPAELLDLSLNGPAGGVLP